MLTEGDSSESIYFNTLLTVRASNVQAIADPPFPNVRTIHDRPSFKHNVAFEPPLTARTIYRDQPAELPPIGIIMPWQRYGAHTPEQEHQRLPR